jgi:DNA sulfur modification protein DndE
MKRITMGSLVLSLFILSACGNSNANKSSRKGTISDTKIVQIAKEAYAFGYPMILMDYTMKISTNVEKPASIYAPINQLGHFREFPNDKFTAVVKPNVDTYYSNAWFDLKAEPVVLSVPASDRYYLLPLYDAYSNVFFVPGPRTTGIGAHTFLLAGPFWKGKVPKGMTLIKAPTNIVWLVGRTQVNSAEDGATIVAGFQGGLRADLLSNYGKKYKPAKGKVIEAYKKIVPVENTRALTTEEYFNKLAQLMVDNPPAAEDAPLVKKMASIGIVAGKPFSMANFSPELRKKLNAVPEQEHQKWIDMSTGKIDAGLPIINNWLFAVKGMGNYGTNYDFRAFIAFIGLGANLVEDAVYPTTSLDS